MKYELFLSLFSQPIKGTSILLNKEEFENFFYSEEEKEKETNISSLIANLSEKFFSFLFFLLFFKA